MKKNTVKEIPITFESEGQQLVGMLHRGLGERLVILCHGFTGHKSEARRIFVEAGRAFAAEGLDAFRFDFYGSGDSAGEFAETRISHNIANLVDACAWAKSQGYQEIAVLGLSMGGATAILTQSQIASRVLVTWSAVPDMGKLFQSYVSNAPQLAAREDLQFYDHDGWLIAKEFWHDAMSYDIQSAFAGITVPKLIIQGSEDSPVFLQGFQAFRDIALPPAEFMDIPGANHTFTQPQLRRQVIRQTLVWLKRNFA